MKIRNKLLLVVCLLLLAVLACGQYIAPTITPTIANTSPLPTQTPIPPTLEVIQTVGNDLQTTGNITAIVLLPVVNVRDSNGSVIGYLRAGDTVTIVSCGETMCEISLPIAGYVWRGCLSDNPEGLECRSK